LLRSPGKTSLSNRTKGKDITARKSRDMVVSSHCQGSTGIICRAITRIAATRHHP
jgi:hypothetical protein